MPPLPIEGALKHYAWGSQREIAELLGRSPSGLPEAELWFGAHESGPSALLGSSSGTNAKDLLEYFREGPGDAIGEGAIARLGNRFPFLLKVLAAAEPLSLQAHPTLEQARAGYRRERARGLAPESSLANYKDENHKPELLLALRPFSVLAGFCPWDESLRRFALFGLGATPSPIDEPLRVFSEVQATGSEPAAREAFFRALFHLPVERRHEATHLIAEAADTVRAQAGSDGMLARHIQSLVEKYPNDPGLVLVLIMNYAELEPGQALFMPARKLHAYLDGLGLEVMASSDNVLRGGLTPKRVDVAELCRVLDFASDVPLVLDGIAVPSDPSVRVLSYPAPVSEFLLSIVTIDEGGTHRLTGPALALVLEGTLVLASGASSASVALGQGGACFVPVSDGLVALSGPARVAVVSLPDAPGEK